MTEEWRPVVGWEDSYSVSSLGRVRSEERKVVAGSGWRISPQHILRPQPDRDGYPQVSLTAGKRRTVERIHRMVTAAFLGPKPDGLEVRHYPDNDKTNCRADNLSYCTSKENKADKIEHGTHSRGIRHNMVKLTEEEVRSIRLDRRKKKIVAEQHGVCISTIYKIKQRRIWPHLADEATTTS